MFRKEQIKSNSTEKLFTFSDSFAAKWTFPMEIFFFGQLSGFVEVQ
jgi:hypothetical protein